MTKVKTNITPLGFDVLIEIIEVEAKSKGGIILPNTDTKQIRFQLGKIIRYGQTAFTDCFGHQELPSQDQPYVLTDTNSGIPFYLYGKQKDGGKLHRIINSDNIRAIMNEEEAVAYCNNNENFEFNPTKNKE